MYRLHLTRNLRSLAFILVTLALFGSVGALWWVNRTGLPESWREKIEQEIAKHGAFVEIGSVRYKLLRGIVATDVRVYSEPEHLREISRLEQITLDFDKTKLARGIVNLNKVELHQARLSMPVDPSDPFSESLQISDANGTVFMPGGRRLEIRGASGRIAGIDFKLDARLGGFQQGGKKPPDDSYMAKRRALLAKILHELEQWRFDEKHPPAVRISVDGDMSDWASVSAKLSFQVRKLEKNDHALNDVVAEVEAGGEIVTVNKLQARDSSGVFDGHIDCNLHAREGRFDISSSLDVPALLAAWLGMSPPKAITVAGRQILEADGSFQLDEKNSPAIRMTGHARCEKVTLRDTPFDAVESAFSWRDNSLFLRDLKLIRGDGQAEAKVMIEHPQVRLEVHSTLAIPVYQKLLAGLKIPIAMVVNDFSEREDGVIDFTAEGGFDLTNPLAWAYTGHGSAKNISYRGVPVNAAQCKFTLNHQELDFHDGTVNFNYTKYGLRKAFNGADEGNAKVGRIRFDASSKWVEVEDVRGIMWAAPVVRLFNAKIADSLEQYRFHEPPDMKASGIVDVTPQGRTALEISFSSDHPADYVFLGENLTLGAPRGHVGIHGEKVLISDLKTSAFDGPVAADIQSAGGGRIEGEINWTKLALTELASTYSFQIKGGGTTTGRIHFGITNGRIETMDGEGLVALENTELFAVPMMGPLSRLVSNVLNDEKVAYQRARNAFCTFSIRNGVLSTSDFQTATSSLNFAGEGAVDMASRTVDMTIRMNARGFLLGLITLPLRSFSGLFQFHGTGPLKETKWESMKFTPPPERQREALFSPPRATVISPGG